MLKDTIKRVLVEALTDEQKVRVARWKSAPPEVRAHTDHYFGKDSDDKFEKLEGTQDKSETHKAVERHLGMEIHPDDYKAGIAQDKYGRQVKIGGLLTKSKAPTDLVNSFANDNTRQGKAFTGLTVHTTRSKEGVAGQTSSGQSWEQESCKNLDDGLNAHYVPEEVKAGTVVSYLKDHTGKELARATFHPHASTSDPSKVAYRLNSYYGIDHAGFKEHNEKTERELTPPASPTDHVYKIHPDVYNDRGQGAAHQLHPNVSESEIEKIHENSAKAGVVTKARIESAIANHQKTPPHILSKIVEEGSESAALHAVANKNFGVDQLHDMIDSHNYKVYRNAERAVHENPNINADHLHKILQGSSQKRLKFAQQAAASHRKVAPEDLAHLVNNSDECDPFTVEEALRNPRLPEQVMDRVSKRVHYESTPSNDRGIQNDQRRIREQKLALLDNPKLKPHHVEQIYNTASGEYTGLVRGIAVAHPRAPKELISRVLASPAQSSDVIKSRHNDAHEALINHPDVQPSHLSEILKHSVHDNIPAKVLQHPKSTGEHVLEALKKGRNLNDEATRIAVTHPRLQPEHLHKMLNMPQSDVRRAAASHPNVSSENIDQALHDKDTSVVSAALRNPKITPEQAGKMTNHSNLTIRQLAQHVAPHDK